MWKTRFPTIWKSLVESNFTANSLELINEKGMAPSKLGLERLKLIFSFLKHDKDYLHLFAFECIKSLAGTWDTLHFQSFTVGLQMLRISMNAVYEAIKERGWNYNVYHRNALIT